MWSTVRLIGSMSVDCGLECVVCHLKSPSSVVVLDQANMQLAPHCRIAMATSMGSS